ncbi:MAG: hypothetical protein HY820_34900 [Acidobacteria bacterium]|nr:hypothetical protein [Acidobacteriota bacterium]
MPFIQREKDAVRAENKFGAEGFSEGRYFVVSGGVAGWGCVASEEDEIAAAFFVQECFQVAQPGIAQYTAATPGFAGLKSATHAECSG